MHFRCVTDAESVLIIIILQTKNNFILYKFTSVLADTDWALIELVLHWASATYPENKHIWGTFHIFTIMHSWCQNNAEKVCRASMKVITLYKKDDFSISVFTTKCKGLWGTVLCSPDATICSKRLFSMYEIVQASIYIETIHDFSFIL